jgi:hypothetical protein
MDEVFAVIIEDHHVDTEVKLFRHQGEAISFAKSYVAENKMEGYDWRNDYGDWVMPPSLVYFCAYTSEGDTIRVELLEIL